MMVYHYYFLVYHYDFVTNTQPTKKTVVQISKCTFGVMFYYHRLLLNIIVYSFIARQ